MKTLFSRQAKSALAVSFNCYSSIIMSRKNKNHIFHVKRDSLRQGDSKCQISHSVKARSQENNCAFSFFFFFEKLRNKF